MPCSPTPPAVLAGDESSLGPTDTLAINRLLKRLESAISKGRHQEASQLAQELAQMRVSCSVVRTKNCPQATQQCRPYEPPGLVKVDPKGIVPGHLTAPVGGDVSRDTNEVVSESEYYYDAPDKYFDADQDAYESEGNYYDIPVPGDTLKLGNQEKKSNSTSIGSKSSESSESQITIIREDTAIKNQPFKDAIIKTEVDKPLESAQPRQEQAKQLEQQYFT